MITRALLLVVALLAQPARAQAPFLWQVSGTGATHYLLGSVHMLPASAYPLPAALDRAYATAEVVVLESDLAALSKPELQLSLLSAALSEEGLRAEIDPATYARLGVRVRRLGLPDDVCDRLRAWFCALTLEIAGFQQAGFSPEYGIDQHFHERASDDGKTLAWLESPEDHLALFTQMPETLGPSFLQATLDAIDDADGTPDALVRSWRDGDIDFMAARVEDLRTGYPQAYARLLADRNRAWLAPLQARFRGAEPALVIVGAAHLVGPDGLVRQLRARGFDVRPVDRLP